MVDRYSPSFRYQMAVQDQQRTPDTGRTTHLPGIRWELVELVVKHSLWLEFLSIFAPYCRVSVNTCEDKAQWLTILDLVSFPAKVDRVILWVLGIRLHAERRCGWVESQRFPDTCCNIRDLGHVLVSERSSSDNLIHFFLGCLVRFRVLQKEHKQKREETGCGFMTCMP